MSKDVREINFDFLYKFCNGYRYEMGECLAIPEVRQKMTELYRQGCLLNETVFVGVLKEVYAAKYAQKKENPTFCYRSARKIIREIESRVQ